MSNVEDVADATAATNVRRLSVLNSALATFARYGYRKASMEQVAKDAHISRPGLYFLFASKEELFRAAVSQTIGDDLDEVEKLLAAKDQDLSGQLLASFDRWAGRYVGPIAQDITIVIDDNPELLGDLVITAPRRFADLVARSIAERAGASDPEHAAAIAQTLISASIGIKHQLDDRAAYVDRMRVAIDVLLR
jgi:AcrR family transcriptional regulator